MGGAPHSHEREDAARVGSARRVAAAWRLAGMRVPVWCYWAALFMFVRFMQRKSQRRFLCDGIVA